MATGKITKKSIDALESGSLSQFLWDTDLKGFGAKITPSGSISYVLQFRMGGRETIARRYTIDAHGSPIGSPSTSAGFSHAGHSTRWPSCLFAHTRPSTPWHRTCCPHHSEANPPPKSRNNLTFSPDMVEHKALGQVRLACAARRPATIRSAQAPVRNSILPPQDRTYGSSDPDAGAGRAC